MTGSENSQSNDTIEQQSEISVSPHLLVADGGPTQPLFQRFPDPVLYYEIEQDTAVVRAINPAFETVFDVEESAITDAPLLDQLLSGTTERESDPSWTLVDATGETTRSDETEDTDTQATAEAILARLDEGERVTVEVRRRTDGEQQYFRLVDVATPETDAGGYIVYTTVTELRRQVQDVTARVDRLERVVNITAHDLRNPLEVAKIRLEAARDTDEDVHFEKVEGALDRIQRIIQDALSIGGEAVEPSDSVALDDVAEAAWATVETADATLVLEDDLPTIEADADSLQQVFENLFRNAVEHGGQDVTVTVGSLSNGFYAADDGPGIPSTEHDRVFEPGYSSEDDNTGLGLAIVQQIADDHGWRVGFGSSDAGGARFEFLEVESDGST